MSKPSKPLSYKSAGVDIDAGERLVDLIKPMSKATRRTGVMGGLGGFGGMFDLKAAGYQDPLLVSGTDGVGTKLRIAIETSILDTVGIDLVAMCVNDILAQGAEPLFFLDYFATGKLQTQKAANIIKGIATGCGQAGCALIGGETAEMPGMYEGDDFDLAGFVVGAVERNALLPRHDQMHAGDILIGLPSTGPHSNGYSLIRKIVDISGLDWHAPAPFAPETTLGTALLTPTQIYINSVLPVIKTGKIKGLAHITGGGLTDNVPRMLSEHLSPKIDFAAWPRPEIFTWLQSVSNLSENEMRRTFNCGIGMVLCVAQEDVLDILEMLDDGLVIGELQPAS